MKFPLAIVTIMVLELVLSSPILEPRELTPEQIQRLQAWPKGDRNMWEISGQFEGDMVLTPEQEAALKSRNGVIDTNLRWPNREIPYEISYVFTESERQFIADTLATEFAKTCIKVRPRTSADRDYVYIAGANKGCWSYVGRLGGMQLLNLQRQGCLTYGIVTHEMLHSAGLYHQHSATDRDDWVTIMWQNIKKGEEYNFDKYDSNKISSFGEKYDYDSIMHYSEYAFSTGEKTIVPKDPNAVIGQGRELSAADIRKLNKMYNC